MKSFLKIITSLAILLAIIVSGCSNEPKSNKDKESVKVESEKGEHTRDVGEKGESEEDGTQFGKNDVYDAVRGGAHLILKFDAESNTFKGTVVNTTSEVLSRVRVEVHLSNGVELGPTIAVDLKPDEKIEIELVASEKDFETWSTHAEVGSSEEGHGNEGEGEHGKEGKEGEGEHGGEKESEEESK